MRGSLSSGTLRPVAGEREKQDELDVSIHWPKGYEVDDGGEGALRRRRKPSAEERPAPRRSPRRPTPPTANGEATVLGPPDQAPAVIDPGLSERVDRISESLAAVTDHITKAQKASDKAVRRVERLCSALSVEVAEVGQAISDQVARYSSATTEARPGKGTSAGRAAATSESVTPALTKINQKLDGLAAAVADNHDRPAASPMEGLEELVEGSAEAVTRIETLVEALVEASDARPADISEYSARSLERLGLTVGARFEANTTTAVEAIDKTVNEALERAVAQFKEVAPPLVDRSTTAAITRLEERVAALTRQRDEHDKETKATLNGLEETVGRLASAQAEDLERILDSIEGASKPTPATDKTDDHRLDGIETAIATLAEASSVPDKLDDAIAQRFDAVNRHLEALRRRLPVRARGASGGLDERALGQLATLVAEHLRATSSEPLRAPRTVRPAVRASNSRRPTKSDSAAKAAQSRSRRRPPGE